MTAREGPRGLREVVDMMRALARLVVSKRNAWAIVACVLVVTALAARWAARVEHDDDVLAFLPKTDPDVALFYEVNERFHGLDVALVGIEAGDAFAPDFLARLRDATAKLNATEGVGFALSLANVEDFAPDLEHGGVAVGYLVREVPSSPEAAAALREKAMSRDHVVGTLVSEDGGAALVYCFAAHGAEPKAMAERVRAVLEEAFSHETKHWGGAPFISSYVYGVTQSDLRRLAPWACLAIVVITLASFRDLVGTGLALLSTAIGIVLALGLMGALGVRANIVLGSMPVILFALGSAYPVHLLTRYYALAPGRSVETAIEETVAEMAPTIVATGLTTVVGLLSFIAMDIAPLRTFGAFTALGILATLVLSLTFVPAVVRLTGIRGKAAGAAAGESFFARAALAMRAHRAAVLVGTAIVTLVAAALVGRVETRMETAAFFAPGSPPDRATRFLRDRFGGSQFLQLQVEGDLADPHVLRELRWLADQIAAMPGVTGVDHVANVVAKVNEAMEGDERVPDTAAKVKLLYGFLTGKRAIAQLVSDDRTRGLVHVKVGLDRAADLEALVDRVEALARGHASLRYEIALRDGPRGAEATEKLHAMALARVIAAAARQGVAIPPEQRDRIDRALRSPTAKAGAADPASEAAIEAFVRSDECTAEIPHEPKDAARRIAAALAPLGPTATREAMAAAIARALEREPSSAVVVETAEELEAPVREILRRQHALAAAKALVEATGLAVDDAPRTERLTRAVANAVLDLGARAALLPIGGERAIAATALAVEARRDAGGGRLSVRVTGLPVMHRGLSRSVAGSQIKSLAFALGLVLVLMTAVYRSASAGLLATAPVFLTVLVIYGAMGALGVQLDIGTSMLASLIVGAGVDYAVHLLAAWRAPETGSIDDAARAAGRTAGPAIWTNAVMVAAGFVVLTLGEARPLRNVGALTAAAMIVAGAATFVMIPVLARRLSYASAPAPLSARRDEPAGAGRDEPAAGPEDGLAAREPPEPSEAESEPAPPA